MKPRLNIEQAAPQGYKQLLQLEGYLSTTDIPVKQKELMKIRASQINGCAYCLNMHIKGALKNGETEQRIHMICVWHEADDIFTVEEQLLFKMTEEITLIHQHGLSDETYDKAIRLFGEEKTAQIIMIIITINGWNRLAVSLRTEPEW